MTFLLRKERINLFSKQVDTRYHIHKSYWLCKCNNDKIWSKIKKCFSDYRLVRNFVLNAEAKNQLRILSDVISDDPKSLPSSLSCRDSDKTRRFTTPEDSKEGSSSRTSCPDSDKVGRFTSSEDSEEGSSSRTSCRDSCDAELLRTSSSQDVKESEGESKW